MKRLSHFKFWTYLRAVFIVLIVPGIGWCILWRLSPPNDLITGFIWLVGELFLWPAFIVGLPKLFGKSYKEWLHFDTLQILKAFDNATARTLIGVQDELPVLKQHIERDETRDVLDLIMKGENVLISGESGSGKSGITAAIVKKAIKERTPVLFLDTRHYSVTVNSLSDLQHFVNVEKSLLTCFEKITNQVGSLLLVVDQLDSTIGTPASQVFVELMAQAAIKKGAKIIAVGSVLETSEYQPIHDLKFKEIISQPQDSQFVSSILAKVGVSNPSQALLSLAENLFYLGIAIEAASNSNIEAIDRDYKLLEEYLKELEKIEEEEFVQTAMDIAYDTLLEGKFNFPRPQTNKLQFKRLIQRGLIIELGYQEYRFRHEQLHYFLFVKNVLESDTKSNEIWYEFRNQDIASLLLFALRYYYIHRDIKMMTILDVLFRDLTRFSFYEQAAFLDEMITWEEIESLDLELEPIFQALESGSLGKYFFKHLAQSGNVAWFVPLREHGFFISPPEPVKVDGGFQYPYWPAVSYLASILPQWPEEVITVAEQIQLDNAPWMSDLIKTTMKIPASYAPRVVQLVVKWLDCGMWLHRIGKELLQYWVETGQWESFLTLLDFILTPQEKSVSVEMYQNPYFSPQAKFRFEEYYIEQFLKGDLPNLLEHHCIKILKILESKLIQAMLIENPNDSIKINSYWRSAIESSEQNMEDRCKDLLLSSTREALDHLFKIDSEAAVGIVDEYLQHRFTIFHRLAIYAIRVHIDTCSKFLPPLYADPKYWKNLEYYHDYWLFTNQTFIVISTEQQIDYVERLLGELDEESEDEEKKLTSRHWVYRRLWAIRNHLPTPKAQAVFDELYSEFSDPDPPEWFAYLVYGGDMVWGSPSSQSSKDLLQMTPEEILQELKKLFPTRRHSFDEPTLEGLATELGNAVKSNPSHFESIAPELFDEDIHPTYVSHALRGFRDAWKEKRDFAWEPVIELCYKVSQTEESLDKEGVSPDMLPNYWEGTYAGARKAVVNLLKIA